MPSTVVAKERKRLIHRPAFVGCLYLAMVPLFAVLYMPLSGQFYHAASEYEPTASSQLKRAEGALTEAIISQLRDADPDSELARKKYSAFVDPTSITVRGLSLRGDIAEFDVYCMIFGRSVKGEEESFPVVYLPITVSLGINKRTWTGSENYGVGYEAQIKNLPKFSFLKFDRTMLLPESKAIPGPFLVLKPPSLQEFNEYLALASGRPGFVKPYTGNQFARMLYFSSATITTTGYGDIVPLSTVTRLLATLESIVGVVLAGLFLNAVAASIRSESKPG
jgi:hypothetical protein